MKVYIGTKPEESDIALAEAVATRERLQSTLAKAEAALAITLADAYKPEAKWAEASAKIDKARALCRQLHAAIAEAKLHESIAQTRERMGSLIAQSKEIEKQVASASPPPIQPRPHYVGGENKNLLPAPGWQASTHRHESGFAKREHLPQEARAKPYLLRQTIGLLALVLAYLAYFHVDVQLQIVKLPSIFP